MRARPADAAPAFQLGDAKDGHRRRRHSLSYWLAFGARRADGIPGLRGLRSNFSREAKIVE